MSTFFSRAQNLVPNPSFEDTVMCPYSYSQIYYAVNWFQPNTRLGNTTVGSSTDYFNQCAAFSTSVSVPSNGVGGQNARTGVAYAGFAAYYFGDYREYLEVKLVNPLVAGRKYCISYFVSLANFCSATDAIDMYFSNDSVLYNSWGYINLGVTPQFANTPGNVIADKVNWVPIQGQYIATGGEQFIVIGNFKDNNNTLIDSICPALQPSSYYYIDDIYIGLTADKTNANAGGDKTICIGDSATLGTTGITGCQYNWQPSIDLDNDTIAQPTATPTQTTTYYLTVQTYSTPCQLGTTYTDTVTIYVVNPVFENANAGAAQTLCKGESVTLGTTACANCFYQWQPFGTLDNAAIAQPTATPTQTTTYFLTMTDSVPPCAKTTTDSVNVIVEDCSEQPIEIYNIFTPNGDTHNDVFYIKNLPANSSLQIFNRWGSKVYESSNYNNTWNGDKVPDGTYFYLLTLQNKETFHGFVEIRR